MIEMQVETQVIQSRWGLAIGEDDQAPVIVRYLQERPPASTRRSLTNLMTIQWDYEARMANGMPSRDQSQTMDILEGAVLKALEHTGRGILAAVVTQDGIREWQMYVSNPQEAQDCVQDLIDSLGVDSITFTTQPDSKWAHYSALMNTLAA